MNDYGPIIERPPIIAWERDLRRLAEFGLANRCADSAVALRKLLDLVDDSGGVMVGIETIEVRVDAFVFVAAERYAIRRWLTAASELVAAAIMANIETVKADRGAAQAIIYDVEDLLRDTEPDSSIGTHAEWEANRHRWTQVMEALR